MSLSAMLIFECFHDSMDVFLGPSYVGCRRGILNVWATVFEVLLHTVSSL